MSEQIGIVTSQRRREAPYPYKESLSEKTKAGLPPLLVKKRIKKHYQLDQLTKV